MRSRTKNVCASSMAGAHEPASLRGCHNRDPKTPLGMPVFALLQGLPTFVANSQQILSGFDVLPNGVDRSGRDRCRSCQLSLAAVRLGWRRAWGEPSEREDG